MSKWYLTLNVQAPFFRTIYKNHLKTAKKSTWSWGPTSLLTKWNNCLVIFVYFPYISLLIINSWYTHCFEYITDFSCDPSYSTVLKWGSSLEKKLKKKHLCRRHKNYFYFWKSNTSVINFIVDSRKYDQSFKKYEFVKN